MWVELGLSVRVISGLFKTKNGGGLSSLSNFRSSTLVKNWITVLPNDCQVGDVFGEVCLGWVDHLQITAEYFRNSIHDHYNAIDSSLKGGHNF